MDQMFLLQNKKSELFGGKKKVIKKFAETLRKFGREDERINQEKEEK